MQRDTNGTSTRKCPHCGQWSAWSQQPDDTCTYCGQRLDPQAFANQQRDKTAEAKDKNRFTIDLIEIDPNEPFYLRGPKYLVRAIQISFVAIVSFLIWLVVLIAS
ncbi:MAG: hypothetical protein EOO03_12930 [Chitinophagaceae bacterium]|nr:MAG: hypothetical protein EOO03_12930 [Chitinophagaceae bacterium]